MQKEKVGQNKSRGFSMIQNFDEGPNNFKLNFTTNPPTPAQQSKPYNFQTNSKGIFFSWK